MLRNPTLVCLIALSLALAPEGAAALGLGGMRTQSALNQPFYAEIDLFDVKTDELDAVNARLASRDDFEQAGVERPHFLTRLNFTPMVGPNGQAIVQITSREPIREPYLDFLVEVLWPKGRLVKEYTVLMDPPVSGARRAPSVVQPQVTGSGRRSPPPARPAERPKPPPQRSAARPASREQPASPVRPAPALAPELAKPPSVSRQTDDSFPLRFGPVTSGSGLWKIARRMALPEATVAQTAMALYRNNQDAFVGGNINLLKVGANLVIPTAEALFALDADRAERQFQDALAGRRVTSTPIATIPEQPELRIATAAANDGAQVPSGEDDADLGAPPEKIGELEDDLLRVRETSESNRQETTELRDRIRELEDQLGDIRRLLELRNAQLAQLQMAGRDRVPSEVDGSGLPESDAIETAAGRKLLGRDGALSPPRSAVDLVLDDPGRDLLPKSLGEMSQAPTETNVDRTEQVEDVVAVSPLGETSPTGIAEVDQQAMMLPPGSTAVEIGATGEPDAMEDPQGTGSGQFGFLYPVTDVLPPWALAFGLGAIVMGGLGLLAYRRHRQTTAIESESTALDSDPDRNQGLADYHHADGFATPIPILPSVPDSDAAPDIQPRTKMERVRSLKEAFPPGERLSIDLDSLPESELDIAPSQGPVESDPVVDVGTESPVEAAPNIHPMPLLASSSTQGADVLAEADIYILYGRYREAESILLDELEHSPDRVDLKYKLAEAYIGSENRDDLAALMGQMQSGGEDRDDPARWFTMRQELERMRTASDADDGLLAGDSRSATGSPMGEPSVDEPSMAEPESPEVTLDLDANDVDALGGSDFDDSKDAGFSVSAAEVMPSREDELREQLEDLELDLRDLDMFGDLRDDAPSTRTQSPANSDVAPILDLPSEAPEQSTPSAHRDAPPGLGDDLDLDLDALDRLASLDDIDSWEEGPGPALGRLDEDLRGIDATERSRPDTPLESALKSAPLPNADAPLAAPTAVDPYRSADSVASEMMSSQWQTDSGVWDEAATKMDLARAYIEMEDPDAARTILNEVLVDGTDEQKSEANTLLAKLH